MTFHFYRCYFHLCADFSINCEFTWYRLLTTLLTTFFPVFVFNFRGECQNVGSSLFLTSLLIIFLYFSYQVI